MIEGCSTCGLVRYRCPYCGSVDHVRFDPIKCPSCDQFIGQDLIIVRHEHVQVAGESVKITKIYHKLCHGNRSWPLEEFPLICWKCYRKTRC
jgi:hypothetical protein